MASSGAKRRAPAEFENGPYPSKRRSDVGPNNSLRDGDARKRGADGRGGRFGGRNGNYEDGEERGSAVRRRSRSPGRRDDRSRRRERSPPPPSRRYDRSQGDPPHTSRESRPVPATPVPATGQSQPSSIDPATRLRRRRKREDEPIEDDPVIDAAQVEAMQKMMGFSTFKTTKETKVPGNEFLYGVHQEKKTEYRQYMNRTGGFNRPLSPSYAPFEPSGSNQSHANRFSHRR